MPPTNSSSSFDPRREYFIQAGSIQRHAFILIDDELVMEITDLDPIDASKNGRINFDAHASKLRCRDS